VFQPFPVELSLPRPNRFAKSRCVTRHDILSIVGAPPRLRDNLDLTTPSGRLMFQIIGAMAEFERALIQERVRAGLRNARAKGKRLGRPGVNLSEARVVALRASGASLRAIAKELGVGVGTVHRISPKGPQFR
jgi:DNA invertase Pin-like site-specific DNA recombinase